MEDRWITTVESLFDLGKHGNHSLPGTSLLEVVELSLCEFNDVDRLYIDHETIGGD